MACVFLLAKFFILIVFIATFTTCLRSLSSLEIASATMESATYLNNFIYFVS